MNRKLFWLILLTLIIAISVCLPVCASERNDGGYFTIVDENGNAVYYTGRKVEIGDEFLTENNKRYEVISIDGDIAHAKYKGNVNLSLYAPNGSPQHFTFLNSLLTPKTAEAQENNKIAVYHTHSDESYEPTDGKDSILGGGGIYKVGQAFVNGLKKNGLDAVQSPAKHDPHDDMAYERSRRTAADLLKKLQPAAIFDIHRDAVPPKVYAGVINGQEITKVQLVVGKYGPTAKQIEDYALQMKAAADGKYPGLVKGIFFAKGGDYNQDLHPRSMLVEVGAQTNSREAAERGITLFSDVIPTVLGKTSPGANAAQGTTGLGTQSGGPSGSSKSIGWILAFLVIGGGLFMFLSTGSFKEAKSKLRQLTTTEFANYFGPKKEKSKEDNDKEES